MPQVVGVIGSIGDEALGGCEGLDQRRGHGDVDYVAGRQGDGDENGIEHRLTKVKRPCTNGQVERMNRTIKDAAVKRFHYDDHAQLRRRLADFLEPTPSGVA